MSLLLIVQDACAELGLVQPASVVGSADLQVQLLLRLAGKEGKELARRFDWQRLKTEFNFTCATDSPTQIANLDNTISDFGRYINHSMFNRTTQCRVVGPLSDVEWQAKQASQLNATINNSFRIRGNALLFYPTPSSEDDIYFEYVSTNWAISADNVRQSAWVADTDISLIDEEVVTLGVLWRFLKAKGLDYSEEFASYERALEQIWGPDGARDSIDMTGSSPDWFDVHIPEGDWPEA
jgi:hypothetical protein